MPFRRLECCLVLFLASVASYGQEYGSVSGVVTDSSGAPLPGVSVSITSPALPQGRQTETGSGGRYQFQNLPAAEYTVGGTLAGLGSASRRALVSVGKDTQVNLSLSATITEEITVTAAVSVIDTKSTEVNFNYRSEEIMRLPLPRTYQGLLTLIPGVADVQGFAGGINAGGSRQDNVFLVDGANVTNPYFGNLGIETNGLDIKDFSVMKAGYAPEFGRSAGAVTNAITKSGTNEFQGAVVFEYQPKEFFAESRTGVDEDLDRQSGAFSLGGPLLRDRLFGYASGLFARSERTDRVNLIGPVPDQQISANELFGKLTFAPTSAQLVEIGYRHKPTENLFAGVGSNETPSVATNIEGTDRIATVHWNWTVTSKTFLEAKYVDSENASDTVAVTQLGDRGVFVPANIAQMGYFSDPTIRLRDGNLGGFIGGASLARNQQDYASREAKLSVSQFFDFGRTAHQVKAGGGWSEGSEELLRVSNAWGSLRRVQNNTQFEARFYPDQPSQLGTGTTYSIYLQDQIQIGQRWVLNVGALANRDVFSQTTDAKRTFLEFGFSDEIQPRIGFTYNLRPNTSDKLYVHYGRYYLLDQKSTARSLAPRRLFENIALFNATTGALISERADPATVAKNISPDIEPTYSNEYLVGYATPLGRLWSIDSYFMYRTSENFIEDFPQTPPASNFIYDNIPVYRNYYALTMNLKRAFTDRWMFETNYTWSRLYGTYDQDYFAAYGGLFTPIFNTSSGLFDTPPLSLFNYQSGPLATDRTHVFKALGSCEVVRNLTLGSVVRVQSGTPWNRRGVDYSGRHLVNLESPGANRGPVQTNVDVLASYRIPVGGRFGVTLEARVFNLFDQQTAIIIDPRSDLGGRIRLTAPPWFREPTANPNPNYGKGLFYATPRRWATMVRVNF